MPGALTYYRPEEVVKNELYSTQVVELEFDPNDFHKIYPNLYPAKGATNKIGSASGIEFLPNVRVDTVYGDVIQNRDGSSTKKPCGIRCTKQGQKMKPDGTMQISSPCTYEFNWEDRAELDFIASEEAGNGKYNSELKKRKHILELKKFASQRASTGAELMVIRELTGMPTAFKESELKSAGWKMKFSQIIKSDAHQKFEAQARLDNIRNGGTAAQVGNNAAALLTGNDTDISGEFDDHFERPTEPQTPAQKQSSPAFESEQPVKNASGSGPVSGSINVLDSNKSENQKVYEELLDKMSAQDKASMIEMSNVDDAKADPEAFYQWAIGQMRAREGAY